MGGGHKSHLFLDPKAFAGIISMGIVWVPLTIIRGSHYWGSLESMVVSGSHRRW